MGLDAPAAIRDVRTGLVPEALIELATTQVIAGVGKHARGPTWENSRATRESILMVALPHHVAPPENTRATQRPAGPHGVRKFGVRIFSGSKPRLNS